MVVAQRLSATLAIALISAAPLGAQAAMPATFELTPGVRPFAPGEKLTYAVKVGPLGKGTAVAEIKGVDTVRGQRVYHSMFRITGSLLFFKVTDYYESWFDPNTLVSLRYKPAFVLIWLLSFYVGIGLIEMVLSLPKRRRERAAKARASVPPPTTT